MEPFLVARGLTKRFPGVLALDGVDFDLRAGEIHVLLGENGAGKSTLVKVLSGVMRPDEGELLLDAVPVRLDPPSVARAMGIGTVYQELALAPDMTVTQNIFLGRETVAGRIGMLDTRTMRREARRLLRLLDVELDPDTAVRRLSLASRQVIEIVRALAWHSRALIMDEPTSALSAHESEELFTRIARLKSEGVGIVYISHRLEEIERIADRVTVMRDGRVVAARSRADLDTAELIRLMVGRELSEAFPARAVRAGAELLRVEHLSVRGRVSDVGFTVHEGEVLGIAGLVGAGRSETLRCLVGLEQDGNASVFVRGRSVLINGPRDALRARIGLVPEDRHVQGLVLPMSVEQNIVLGAMPSCSRGGFLRFGCLAELARRYVARLRIRIASPRVRVATLSGGNQQKVVFARALAAGSEVLLLDEPTRGIDVGSKVEIYQLIAELAAAGKAIVVVSSELTELLGLADRIVVMRQGHVSATFAKADATQEKILAAALPREGLAA